MVLCTTCLHTDDRKLGHCPLCAGNAFAQITSDGDLITVPAEAGLTCATCGEVGRELKLRYYRRVLGLAVVDRIWSEAGYYCGHCRRRKFAVNMAVTLVFGWWGLLAMLFRNPYAILVNTWALFATPFWVHDLPAINVADIGAADDEDDRTESPDGDQRTPDSGPAVPEWLAELTDAELTLVVADVDYYRLLGVSPTATTVEIRTAWRRALKGNHPDVAGDDGHQATVVINDAWAVLGNDRLRHAYDHRDELGPLTDNDDSDLVVGCRACMLGFEDYETALDHVDEIHPGVADEELLIALDDDDEDDADTNDAAARWRCKACDTRFSDYDDALEHADAAHPERINIDPRTALETV